MLGKLMNLLDTTRGGVLVVGSPPTLQLVSPRLTVQALALPINCVDGPTIMAQNFDKYNQK